MFPVIKYSIPIILIRFTRVTLIRGGIIFWADSLGSKYVCSKLEEWSNVYGAFFKPCACLAERASKGLSLVRNLSAYLLD